MSELPSASLGEVAVEPPPTEANAAVSGRILQFDGLRALAFAAVFINHSTHTPLLWAGVDLFFVLSGFLITGILLQRKHTGSSYFGQFYRRRAYRILPSYLLTIVIYGFLSSWQGYKPLWLFLLAPNVQDLRSNGQTLLPLWSLAVEEQFYLIWPLVVLFTSEKTLLRLSIAAVVFTPVLRMVCAPYMPNHLYIYSLTPFRADLLCAGAVLALLWKQRTPATAAMIHRWSWPLCLVGFGLFAGTQVWPVFRLASNSVPANGFVYLFSLLGATGLLAAVLTSSGWLKRLLSFRPLRYLGEISYTMYLIHVVFLVRLQARFGPRLWVNGTGLLLIILYASVSWFLLEKPLIRFAARRPVLAGI
ncbi:MAG: acyltransferase family protein [Janthinobacterium lividum]